MLMSLMFAASLGASAAAGQDLYVTKPDYVVYVPGRARSAGRGPATERGETYNDHFQVLWDDGRKLYHAFWTQGSWEGAGDHHIMYSKSADKGRTWSEPTVLAGSERRACKRFEASWQQPMLSKSGRLYCLWNQKVRKDKLPREYLAGFYSDDGGDTWGEPGAAARPRTQARQTWKIPIYKAWINWQRPLRLAVAMRYSVRRPTSPPQPYSSSG